MWLGVVDEEKEEKVALRSCAPSSVAAGACPLAILSSWLAN